MARRHFIWQVFPAFLLITLFSIVAVSYYVTRTVEDLHLSHTESDLISRARLLVSLAEKYDPEHNETAFQAECKLLGASSATRITFIQRDGRVVADSDEQSQHMDNHANRPEVMAALTGEIGRSVRFSHTLNTQMMYVALPPSAPDNNLIVRVAIPIQAIGQTLRMVYIRLALVVVLVAVLAGILSWFLSRRVMRPLADLKIGAERFARGHLEVPLPIPDTEEFARLTESLNIMARQLSEHIQAVEKQRNEQEAVLASMGESVLAIDSEMRIITINDAASTLLNLGDKVVKGRTLVELVRSTALHRFARKALNSEGLVEAEIDFSGLNTMVLRAQGTVLRDGTGASMGAVIVLDNLTQLRRLEAVRQDFVANVSHELKTPITSIKGFVETLLDENEPSPEDSRHFLHIIEKQANRLDAIIEDLLSLSRLEQGAGRASLQFSDAYILPIIQASAELCQHRASMKGIEILLDCSESLTAPVNAPLLEQGLVNLIDNAVKYSDADRPVLVRARDEDGRLQIDVADEGAGIPATEINRIFERFYRVDKARSSDQGGTGLGLSIVKHIAQVHGGTVTVSSAPGEGSTFSLNFPLANQPATPY